MEEFVAGWWIYLLYVHSYSSATLKTRRRKKRGIINKKKVDHSECKNYGRCRISKEKQDPVNKTRISFWRCVEKRFKIEEFVSTILSKLNKLQRLFIIHDGSSRQHWCGRWAFVRRNLWHFLVTSWLRKIMFNRPAKELGTRTRRGIHKYFKNN